MLLLLLLLMVVFVSHFRVCVWCTHRERGRCEIWKKNHHATSFGTCTTHNPIIPTLKSTLTHIYHVRVPIPTFLQFNASGLSIKSGIFYQIMFSRTNKYNILKLQVCVFVGHSLEFEQQIICEVWINAYQKTISDRKFHGLVNSFDGDNKNKQNL